ncbi:MAG: hypothetical protein ACRD2J_05235 [Thermoanaerobaculia bacterium]
MAEFLHEYESRVVTSDGTYRARALAEQRKDGTWSGWLEFEPAGGGNTIRTEQETSQPDREAVEYWATGIEPIYLEGALERAKRRPVGANQ